MKRKQENKADEDLRAEYDLGSLMKKGVKGKYAERYRSGTNLVLLEPDIARNFPDDASVNEALRLVMKLTDIPGKKSSPVRTRRKGH